MLNHHVLAPCSSLVSLVNFFQGFLTFYFLRGLAMALVANNQSWNTGNGRTHQYFREQIGWKYQPRKSAPDPLPPLTFFKREARMGPPAIAFSQHPAYPPDYLYWSSMIQRQMYEPEGLSLAGVPTGTVFPALYNKAYSRFISKVFGDTSSLGVSVAEGREALVGIVERAGRLGRAYKALRRGRFREFLHQLGGRPKEKHKHTAFTRPKDASALWLEYWLAWAPLVGDVQNSVSVLTSSGIFPEAKIRASARYVLPSRLSGNVGGFEQNAVGEGLMRCALGCTVQVHNPNAYLAARMGLVQWKSIGWAVVPFSFVVDWFVNIGQILNHMDFSMCGVTFTEAWATSSVSWQGDTRWTVSVPPIAAWSTTGRFTQVRRVTLSGFPRPPVVFNKDIFKGISPTRGATAISLLLSIFTKG